MCISVGLLNGFYSNVVNLVFTYPKVKNDNNLAEYKNYGFFMVLERNPSNLHKMFKVKM